MGEYVIFTWTRKKTCVQVGQLFNLFERDLDCMEEDLGGRSANDACSQGCWLPMRHKARDL